MDGALVYLGSGAPGGNEDVTWQYVGVGRDDGKKAGEYCPHPLPYNGVERRTQLYDVAQSNAVGGG